MKLPRLSPDEIRDLQVDGRDPDWNLAERIKAHLMAGLPAHVRVEVGVPASAGSKIETESPHLRADDNLLAAWVAARFGSGVLCKPVPAHYGARFVGAGWTSPGGIHVARKNGGAVFPASGNSIE